MRSLDQGNTWEAISDDLTKGGKRGNVAYGTLTSISESPFQFGLIYTGSDDGLIHVTKNGGAIWEDISSNLPKDLWVSRVIASSHKKERVYATLNGYRWDDFSVYIYRSDDYGQTWKNISSNVPMSPVNVIKEDPVNQNILYLGTDNGAYVSFNKGETWQTFSKGLPAVAVHDLVIHEDTNDLLLATHGRSIYKTSVANLQKYNDVESASQNISIFDINNIRYSGRWGSSWNKWAKPFEPKVVVEFYSNISGQADFNIVTEKGTVLHSDNVKLNKGFNYVDYGLEITEKAKKKLLKENTSLVINKAKNGKFYLPKGKYFVKINNTSKTFEVK